MTFPLFLLETWKLKKILWRIIFFLLNMRIVAQTSIQTKFQMWNYNPYLWMETQEPLSQSGNWQFYLHLLGHTQWDTNQEKEQGRNMRGNAKTICLELVFYAAGTAGSSLLSSLESSLPLIRMLKRRNSKHLLPYGFQRLSVVHAGNIKMRVRRQGSLTPSFMH